MIRSKMECWRKLEKFCIQISVLWATPLAMGMLPGPVNEPYPAPVPAQGLCFSLSTGLWQPLEQWQGSLMLCFLRNLVKVSLA